MVVRLVRGVEAGPDFKARLDWRSYGTGKRERLNAVESTRKATQPDTTRLVFAAGLVPSSWIARLVSSGLGEGGDNGSDVPMVRRSRPPAMEKAAGAILCAGGERFLLPVWRPTTGKNGRNLSKDGECFTH